MKKIDSELSRNIIHFLKTRECVLLNNDAFVSAVYLDPRLNVMLDDVQKGRAKLHLSKLWARLKLLDSENTNEASANSDPNSQNEDELDILMKSREKEAKSTYVKMDTAEGSPICHLLNEFLKTPRLDKSQNVLKYWDMNRYCQPELFKLAQTVMAVPVTQVSVERMFSGLKFVLSPYRSCLSPEIVQDLMIIRCNSIFHKIYKQ